MAKKLNSMRVLERARVPFQVLTFPDSIHSADGVAEHLDIPVGQVFKTLVVECVAGGKPYLVMVPADRELNLRQLAGELGEKKLRMARQVDAERMTGLLVGGISALALLNRGFRILIDSSATTLEQVIVSAGQRGVNLKLASGDLIRVTGARVVNAT